MMARTFSKVALLIMRSGPARPIMLLFPVPFQRVFEGVLRRLGMELPGPLAFLHPSAMLDGTVYGIIRTGELTTISREVLILAHDYSIQRYITWLDTEASEARKIVAPVAIGCNCFIGARAVLLPGAVIGDNSIVGAGSVVRSRIPDGAMVTGNAATVTGQVDEWGQRNLSRAIRG